MGVALLLGKELLDSGEHHASRVNRELGAQVGPAVGLNGRLAQQLPAAGEGAKELVVQVVAVGQHNDGGVGHGPLADDAPGVKGHAQALARALSVPDHTDAPVAWCAARLAARLMADGLFSELLCRLTQLSRPQGLSDRHFNRVKLVVARHLLDQRSAPVILEDDEVADQSQEPLGHTDAFQHHLQLGQERSGQALAGDRAPGLEPLPSAREGADASLYAVRDDQGRVHSKQRR